MNTYQCEDCAEQPRGLCRNLACPYCCNCGREIKAFEDPTIIPLLLEVPAAPTPVEEKPEPMITATDPLPNDIPGVVAEIFDMEQDEMPEEWFRALRDDTFTHLGALTHERWQKLGYQVELTPLSQLPVEPEPKDGQVQMLQDGKVVWADSSTGFVKNDSGKNRFSLMPAEARAAVAQAFTYGAQKYPPHNFRKGTEWSRYVDALYRHMNAWEMREDADPESGLNHLAHASACLMILLTLQLTNKGTDDRP